MRKPLWIPQRCVDRIQYWFNKYDKQKVKPITGFPGHTSKASPLLGFLKPCTNYSKELTETIPANLNTSFHYLIPS